MPNAQVWGNDAAPAQQLEQDLISPPNPVAGDRAILRVNDVNNANKIALYARNSNTGANSRALRASGKSDFLGYGDAESGAVVGVFGNLIVKGDDAGNPASTAIDATNASTHADARALKVEGMAEIVANSTGFPASMGLEVKNESENPFARVLKVTQPYTGDPVSTISTEIINLSTHQNARALKVEGRTEVEGIATGNLETTALQALNASNHDDALAIRSQGRVDILANNAGSPALNVEGANLDDNSRALRSNGIVEMTDSNRQDETIPILEVRRGGGFPNARAVIARGMSEMIADSAGNPVSTGLKVTNASNNAAARALEVVGISELGGDVLVGTDAADGMIDCNAVEADGRDLLIGTQVATTDVHLSRPNQTIDMFGQARLRGNAIITNIAPNILDPMANGIVDFPAGHGFGPSIDFVINGVARYCVDSTGGHNV